MKEFKSAFGDSFHLQNRILEFGRSGKMLFYNTLILIGFFLSCVSIVLIIVTDFSVTVGDQSYNFIWLKFLAIVVLGFIVLIPLALTLITYGSRTINVIYVMKGLRLFNVIWNITFVSSIIGVIAVGILVLVLMTKSFVIALLFGGLLALFFIIYFKFLDKAKFFLYQVTRAFTSMDNSSLHYPSALTLKPYLIAYLVLDIINWLSNLSKNNAALEQFDIEGLNFLQNVSLINNIASIIGIFSLGFLIYLTSEFDTFIRIGRPAAPSKTEFKFDDSRLDL